MANKILIFGATGAVGSSLAKLMQNGSTECHLIGKSQDEVSRLSDETGHSFSVADVLEEGFALKDGLAGVVTLPLLSIDIAVFEFAWS